jgi:DNA-binding NtrC family response regulator
MVRPVGSDRGVRVDVRIIAASNADLSTMMARNAFREDLFYRLQVVPIVIPPLRERRSDIPILVEHFLERASQKHPGGGRPLSVSAEAMVHLWSYDWPGNVRELENLVERMVILSEDGTIEVSQLPPNIAHAAAAPAEISATLDERGLDLNKLVRKLEGRLINQALRQTRGNKQAAARLLGLKRTTFGAQTLRRNRTFRCGLNPTIRGKDPWTTAKR